MNPEDKAKELGVEFTKQEPGYLNLCIRSGNLLITSGHTSDLKGVLGKGLTVKEGYTAAKDCATNPELCTQRARHHQWTEDHQAFGLRLFGAGLHRSASGHQWCL